MNDICENNFALTTTMYILGSVSLENVLHAIYCARVLGILFKLIHVVGIRHLCYSLLYYTESWRLLLASLILVFDLLHLLAPLTAIFR